VPVYEYACTACGENLEVRQSFTDDALTTCPVCAGRLRKVLSAVGVVFKGSGFYRNDSRASETKEPAKVGADAKGAAASDGSSKSTGAESGGSGKESGGSKSEPKVTTSSDSSPSGRSSSGSSGAKGSSSSKTAAR